jgi:hypothetical protein
MEHPLALLHGFVSVPAVNLFTELGFTQLWLKGEQVNLEREVERQNLEPDIVLSLARYFVRYDYLAETEPNVFALTARGRVYFGAWGALGRWYSYHPFLSSLPSLARKAGAAGYHQDAYRDFAVRKGGPSKLFDILANYIQAHRFQHIMDLGGGGGDFLVAVVAQNPSIRLAALQCSPLLVEQSTAMLEKVGARSRSTLLVADLFELTELGEVLHGVDFVTIFYRLHELTYSGSSEVLRFLGLYRKAFGRTPLAITESYYVEDAELREKTFQGTPEIAVLHDMSRQKWLRREEWVGIYDAARFRVIDSFIHRRANNADGRALDETLVLQAA